MPDKQRMKQMSQGPVTLVTRRTLMRRTRQMKLLVIEAGRCSAVALTNTYTLANRYNTRHG